MNHQPHKEANTRYYIYFVIFILFGTFFCLNLLLGVLVDSVFELQALTDSSDDMFMTEDQKKYDSFMKKLKQFLKTPIKFIPKPTWKPQTLVYHLVRSSYFRVLVALVISMDMVMEIYFL